MNRFTLSLWLAVIAFVCVSAEATMLDTDPGGSPQDSKVDIHSIEVTAGAKTGDPLDTPLTFTLCVKGNPGNNNSFLIQVGAASIRLTHHMGSLFTVDIREDDTEGWGSGTTASFDSTQYKSTDIDGNTTTVTVYCITFTLTADTQLGLGASGRAEMSISSHANNTAANPAQDTMPNGAGEPKPYVKW